MGRAPPGSASGSSYIPGGQRLLGNGQSNALKLPWVRPTELLGLPSTLPDVTLLLHKWDSETREGQPCWVACLRGSRSVQGSFQNRLPVFQMARLTLVGALRPGLNLILPHPGRVI